MRKFDHLPEDKSLPVGPVKKESVDCSADISSDVLRAVEDLNVLNEDLEECVKNSAQNLDNQSVKEKPQEGAVKEGKKDLSKLERKVRIEKVVDQLNSFSSNKWKRVLHKNILGAKRILPLFPMCGVLWGGGCSFLLQLSLLFI